MQAGSAIASAQNTSRSLHHAHSAAPAFSLDLKSLSLRETFQSLTDSSRDRTASARTAPGLTARQPVSPLQRHPVVPSPSKAVGTLADLFEEPELINGNADCIISQQNYVCCLSQRSSSRLHHALNEPQGGLNSSAQQLLSAGSSGQGSSRSSSYCSSCNSSRSSSSVSDGHEVAHGSNAQHAEVRHVSFQQQQATYYIDHADL